MAQNNQINVPTPFAINKGGTGVTSVTTAPTASAWAGWDANKNLSANNHIEGYTTTATAAGTTTLVVGSTYQQFFTGSTTQTVTLPVTSTMVLGQAFYIVNNSSGNVTVNSSGGNAVQVMTANTTLLVTVILTSGTTAASWATEYVGASSGGTVSNGTINQLAWYAATGTTVSGLSIVNSAVLTTTSGGVPTWVAYTGTNAPVLGTAPTISAPKLDQINDQTNNGKVVSFSGAVSAVNYTNIVNGATGVDIGFQFLGSDSNVFATFSTKGTGTFSFFNGFSVSTQPLFVISGAATNTVNYLTAAGSITTSALTLTATGTDTNISLNIISKGTGRVAIQGTSTNTAAAAGYVGEFMSASNTTASPIVFTASVAKTLQSITLTAGDWDVWGNIYWSGTTVTGGVVSINTTTNTHADLSLAGYINPVVTSANLGICAPQQRFLVSGSTTVYIVGSVSGTGTLNGSGGIYARRRS